MKKIVLLTALVCAGSLVGMNVYEKQRLDEALLDATSTEEIKQLIDKGANAGFTSGGHSALEKHIGQGNLSAVMLLIQYGAKPTAFDLDIAQKQAILKPNDPPMKRYLFEDRTSQEKADREEILKVIQREFVK